NGAEGAVGVGADRGDGRDADHDDQRQHDSVLDRRRAVFRLQELNHVLNSAHRTSPSKQGGKSGRAANGQEPTAAFRAALAKVSLAFLPRRVMAAMQTTTMRASITAYSTAVGPSSPFKNHTAPRPSVPSIGVLRILGSAARPSRADAPTWCDGRLAA